MHGEPSMETEAKSLLYIGTYAEPEAAGIFVCSMDIGNGALERRGSVMAGANPSFLTISPDGRSLYAVNELSEYEGKPGGTVSAFAIDPDTGRLAFLNRQPSHGAAPCHLTTDRQGHFLLVANYLSGTLAVYPLDSDGRLQASSQVIQHERREGRPEPQEGPHAHSVSFTADNRFVLSCDLGIDKVLIYGFDPFNGALTPHDQVALERGAGPRHLDFHPARPFVYVIDELDSTVTGFAYAADAGKLTKIQVISTLPEGYAAPSYCAEIKVHPTGKYVYGSNRGHDSIVIYAVEATGHLTLVGHEPTRGKMPRNFAIDPTGTYLVAANQASNTLVSFRIDAETGRLHYLQSVEVPRPVCVKFYTPINPPPQAPWVQTPRK